VSIIGELALLFLWSFLAATLVPLGSEVSLALVVSRHELVVLPVAVASAGNTLGALATWWMGRKAARAVGRRREASAGARRAAALLRRYGAPALVLSWVPVIGDALVAAAGAAGLSLRSVLPWTVVGKVGRYAVLAISVQQVG
jgi:membrane protein YqaA with SNARE-associated domain